MATTATELKRDAGYFDAINAHRAKNGKGPHPDTPGLGKVAPPADPAKPKPTMACDEPRIRDERIESLRMKVEAETARMPPEPNETEEAKRRKRKPHEGEAESFAKRMKAAEKLSAKPIPPPEPTPAPEPMPDIVPSRTNPEISSPGRLVLGDADSDMGEMIRAAGSALASGSPLPVPAARCGDVQGSFTAPPPPVHFGPEPDPAWVKIRQTADAIQALLDAVDVYPPDVARLALDWVTNRLDASEA